MVFLQPLCRNLQDATILWIIDNFLCLSIRRTPQNGGLVPYFFKKAPTVAEVLFHSIITDNFIFDQDQLETNFTRLLADPELSEWRSIISVIIFEVNIVREQKQAR